MIEAGTPGAAARAHAAALRADAALDASDWFLRVAEHQEATGARLALLPPAWAILHEVAAAGIDGLIDHVVVGPGGAFIVVTRPCLGELTLEGGHITCAGQPIDADLERVRHAAVVLTSQLGTAVVPVLALATTALPPGAPLLAGGTMVCTTDRLVNTITKATHTALSADSVVGAVEAAAPLLRDRSSMARPDRRTQVRGDREALDHMPDLLPKAELSVGVPLVRLAEPPPREVERVDADIEEWKDRKSTRLNSSH